MREEAACTWYIITHFQFQPEIQSVRFLSTSLKPAAVCMRIVRFVKFLSRRPASKKFISCS